MREGFAPEKIDFNVRGLSFRGMIRVCLFILHVVTFLLSHLLITLLVPYRKLRLKIFIASNRFHCRFVLFYLGVRITQATSPSPVKGKLIVCNHLSYIDVLVLFAYYPSLFITSKEIEKTPVLGQITKLAGCFFVERKKALRTPETILRELEEMKLRLAEGFNVFLFPEGTSSDGQSVLPFKAHFFQLASSANIQIQPLVIKYNGPSRQRVPWFGEMSFFPHFVSLCQEKNISLILHELPVIDPTGRDHFDIKESVFHQIRSSYETN